MYVKKSAGVFAEKVSQGSGTTKQVLISSEEGPHFAMRRFTMEAGGGMPLHTNSVEHEQYVLEGKAKVVIGKETFEVIAGDVVFIPAGVPHSYANIGEGKFSFLCLIPNLPDTTTLVSEGAC